MGAILGYILGFILLLLYFGAILFGLYIIGHICLAALTIGALFGIAVGIFMGIKNYFAALFSQVKLRQSK